ncbi:glyoxalase superfamily protein [Micavibrio aeruginosavorus]|uniref:glyoxalase superfamily protein n=1 Tax=Micavibrio aeruginosavorus TaxID=349221 RepID=UPI0005A249EF|nr:glyoxalase superfamily protein [Micavibrio aeruginosavorus]
MSTPTQESLKQQAKVIRKFLNEKYQVDVSHGHCMELISQLFGFKDWNTATAALKPKAKQDLLPIHIKTVGDMKKALALFDDDTAIFDGEYEFKIQDFINEINAEDWDGDTILTQEFSLVLEEFVPDIASFKLKIEHESLTIF